MDIKRQDLFCTDCMSPSTTRGFKQVIGLKTSGLLIYLHKILKEKINAADKSKSREVFILHNDSEHDLRRPDYAIEMCQLRTRCFRCINLVKRVRSLLDEIHFIGKNQVIGICEHCKRNPGACKRCQYIVNKFKENKTQLHKEKQAQFKSWLSKLNQFFHSVLNDENLDWDQINRDPSALELETLLQELKWPLELRKLHTTYFPADLAQLSSTTAGNDMIDELLAKIKPEDLRTPVLDEDLPPKSEGMQLLQEEHQEGEPRRLPPLTRAMQKNKLLEGIENDNVLENQSKDTSRNEDIKKQNKEDIMKQNKEEDIKKQNKEDIKKQNKKENIKLASEMLTKDSTSKPLLRKFNKGDGTDSKTSEALQNKNDIKKQNIKDMKNQNKNQNIQLASKMLTKDSISKPLIKKFNKGDGKENKNSEALQNKKDIKKQNKKENFKLASEMLTKDSTSKPLSRKFNKGDGIENKNSEAIQAKEINLSGKNIHSKNKLKDEKAGKKSVNIRISSDRSDESFSNQIINRSKEKNDMNEKKNITIPQIHRKGKDHMKESKIPRIPTIQFEHLPSLKTQEISYDENFISLDTFLKMDDNEHLNSDLFSKMSKSTKLMDLYPHNKDNFLSDAEKSNILPVLNGDSDQEKEEEEIQEYSDKILRYKLSDETFIRKGYTILPTIKVMKRINLYKMEPVNPKFNWFERHKDQGTKNYDTGEILAEIENNGTGKWFYKNGRIALDYYNAEDQIAGQRYVLYSSGEENNQDLGAKLNELKSKPQVLGVFDLNGNGVVYSIHGKERIKYNQTEGIIKDHNIAPVSRWKWHSLNDPPVLETLFRDNYESSACIDELSPRATRVGREVTRDRRQADPELLKTEFQIYAQQKAYKLLQKFKPYQIRMKAFKINDEFSLRIIDQANIYLLFRQGTTSLKLNLGLRLVSNEIVDTDVAEADSVASPCDRLPPRTSSIVNIQSHLQNARALQRKAEARKHRILHG